MVSTSDTPANQQNLALPEPRQIEGLQVRALDDPRLVERIRVLDTYCLPVKYSDHYYDSYVRPCVNKFSCVAFYHGILVGSCTCRLEAGEGENKVFLYIMTIAVLEPYRRLGIGSQLLGSVLRAAAADTKLHIQYVTLHMQVNSPALLFYKAFGFEVAAELPDYYPELEEKAAYLLRRSVYQPHFDPKHQNKAKGTGVKGAKKNG
uniref:Putative N-acetyltransferase n=1 Tax=Trypanosoma congolense (strain IL3000) TaxID=1068625 RepID=G0UVT4_TRYCI|nr:putative N-acetyltransferase [Trypanosoma congolense IL3000]